MRLEDKYRERIIETCQCLAGPSDPDWHHFADLFGVTHSTLRKYITGKRQSTAIPEGAARVWGGWFAQNLAKLQELKKVQASESRREGGRRAWAKRHNEQVEKGEKSRGPDIHFPSPHPQPPKTWY